MHVHTRTCSSSRPLGHLWTGLGMLLLGLFFLAWLKLRPTAPPAPTDDPAP
nr:hypothetical protein [Streptomyces sp. AC550_RSS872]